MNAKKTTGATGGRGGPVSLHPLDPEQALKALLKVEPPPDARSQKTRKSVNSGKKAKKKLAPEYE